jgi:hypothetical protein
MSNQVAALFDVLKWLYFKDSEFAEFSYKICVRTRRYQTVCNFISFFSEDTNYAPKPNNKIKLVRHSATKVAKFFAMKWMVDRIRQLVAAYLQKPASDPEPITPTDPHQTGLVPSSEPPRSLKRTEMNFDARRKELGVEDGLKDIPGITPRMLVAFGEHGIKSVEDLADCATDDLHGWRESKDGKAIRHAGILSRFRVSRKACEAIIMNARTKAGWFK